MPRTLLTLLTTAALTATTTLAHAGLLLETRPAPRPSATPFAAIEQPFQLTTFARIAEARPYEPELISEPTIQEEISAKKAGLLVPEPGVLAVILCLAPWLFSRRLSRATLLR